MAFRCGRSIRGTCKLSSKTQVVRHHRSIVLSELKFKKKSSGGLCAAERCSWPNTQCAKAGKATFYGAEWSRWASLGFRLYSCVMFGRIPVHLAASGAGCAISVLRSLPSAHTLPTAHLAHCRSLSICFICFKLIKNFSDSLAAHRVCARTNWNQQD